MVGGSWSEMVWLVGCFEGWGVKGYKLVIEMIR